MICHVTAVSHIVQRRGTKTRVATKFLTLNKKKTLKKKWLEEKPPGSQAIFV